eukprot:scaffold147339_cov35-Prasinocladus_malaysianus.AAC.1
MVCAPDLDGDEDGTDDEDGNEPLVALFVCLSDVLEKKAMSLATRGWLLIPDDVMNSLCIVMAYVLPTPMA